MSTSNKLHKCNSCGIEDPTAFHNGCKSKCRQCKKTARQTRYILELEEIQGFIGQTKVCATCGQEKDTTHFVPQNSDCKPCISQKNKVRRCQNYAFYIWKNAKYRASKKGLEFTITQADIHIPDTCPVLGIPLSTSTSGRQPNSPSLDRIDNSKGYTPSNIQVISWRANRIKADASADELRRVLAYMEGRLLP